VNQPELGRRERKKLRTRRSLQAAAVRLAAERGLQNVTTEEIAAGADVSPRTFFNYFSSKEEALTSNDSDRAEWLRAALAARPASEPPLTALRAVMLEWAAGLADRREEALQRLEVIRSDPSLLAASFGAWSRIERALTEAVGSRAGLHPERDPYPALLVAAVSGVTRVAVMRWRDGNGDVSLDVLVGDAIDAVAAGLPLPSGGEAR